MLAREQAARLKPYVAGWRRGPEWAKGGMLGKNRAESIPTPQVLNATRWLVMRPIMVSEATRCASGPR
eukprot:scaffold18425_cov51-Phaeocystis_antarctica.AAC.4